MSRQNKNVKIDSLLNFFISILLLVFLARPPLTLGHVQNEKSPTMTKVTKDGKLISLEPKNSANSTTFPIID